MTLMTAVTEIKVYYKDSKEIGVGKTIEKIISL